MIITINYTTSRLHSIQIRMTCDLNPINKIHREGYT